MKIDFQGSEMAVLKGIKAEHFHFIKWLYIEVTDHPLYDGQASYSQIHDLLSSKGYMQLSLHNQNYLNGQILYADALYAKI